MNESLRRVIKELHDEAQSNSLILNQAKVKLQECKEQNKQLTLKYEDLEKEMKKIDDAAEKLWKDKETAWQAENKILRGVIKDLKDEVQDLQEEITSLIHDQAKVKSQECKEQTNKSAFKSEECEKPFEILAMEESSFIEKIQNLEKQHAHQFQFGGHKLAVLTHESFNDIVTELNEMKRIVAEQQDLIHRYNTDMVVVDKKYQDRIQFLDRKKNESERQLVQFRNLNDEQQSELAIKSKQIEKLKRETSSLKTKNKNITNEFEEKLRKIFNNLMENQIGEKTSLK